ncbi:MAG: BrnT family toxin [Devosia sp.]
MEITFDPAKRERALRERQLDFLDARKVFEGPNYRFVDGRFDYGEVRIVTVGYLFGRMVVDLDRASSGTAHYLDEESE